MTLQIAVFASAILLPALALLAGVTIVASLSRAVEYLGGLDK